MDPGIRLKVVAGNGGRFPAGIRSVVPDVPKARPFLTTFRSPNPTLASERLIQVKLESLRSRGIINVEIQIVGEVADVVSARDRVEVKLIGIAVGSAHGELGGLAVHRRRRLAFDHRRGRRIRVAGGTDLTITSRAHRKIRGA